MRGVGTLVCKWKKLTNVIHIIGAEVLPKC